MKAFQEEEIIESLHGISRAELPPYFDKRILAKWKSATPETNMGKWIPALACTLLVFLLIGNLRMFLQSNFQTKKTLTEVEQFNQTYFSPSNQAIYEINMEQ